VTRAQRSPLPPACDAVPLGCTRVIGLHSCGCTCGAVCSRCPRCVTLRRKRLLGDEHIMTLTAWSNNAHCCFNVRLPFLPPARPDPMCCSRLFLCFLLVRLVPFAAGAR